MNQSSIVNAGLVLTSGFYPGPDIPTAIAFGLVSVAVASDGSLWLTTGTGLYLYSTSEGTFDLVGDVPAYQMPGGAYIAPVNAGLAYYLTGNAPGISVCTGGTTSPVAALPGGDVASALSASPDGTLWAAGSAGALYAYGAANDTWQEIAAPPGTLMNVSVASASWALALVSQGTSDPALYSWNGTAWTLSPIYCPADTTWVAACWDGTCWIAEPSVISLTLASGTVVPLAVPAYVTVSGSYTAASRYGCFFLSVDPASSSAAFGYAGYGITEEPPRDWPSMTPDQKKAYEAISVYLGITDPAGIRGAYGNTINTLTDFFTQVSGMTRPAGVTEADWLVVKTQILRELKYAQSVQNLFSSIVMLNTSIATIQNTEYSGVVQMVGLPANSWQQPQTLVDIILGEVISHLFTAAVAQAPPEVRQVISVGMSLYNFAASQEAKKYQVPNRDTALSIACAKLAGALADMQVMAAGAVGTFETAIVADWGMLEACGVSITSNLWYWPPDFDYTVLNAAGPANALDFYQTLMPVKYQITQVMTLFAMGTGGEVTPPNTPGYALLGQMLTSDSGMDDLGWWQICTEWNVDPVPQLSGPFPNQSLVEAVLALSDPRDFFTNGAGWKFPVSTMQGYTPPPAGTPWLTYVNQSSPLGS